MPAEDSRHAVEHTALQNRDGTVACLLRRLEHDENVAACRPFPEQSSGTHRPCGVNVVPAGVHHTVVHRREWQTGGFGDRQRVDVAAQRDDGRRPIEARHARDDARLANARDLVDPEAA